MQTISPRQLHERQQTQNASVKILDVRTPVEHSEMQVPGAVLMSLDRLNAAQLTSTGGFAKYEPVYLLCRSGSRAKQAADQLEREGFSQCVVVEGGILAWAEAGLPVTRGASKVISLERQVRIAAGLLVCTGIGLGNWVHSAFYGLSAFVGIGLVFAGITDWCGMGMLIARMPWNQRASGTCFRAK